MDIKNPDFTIQGSTIVVKAPSEEISKALMNLNNIGKAENFPGYDVQPTDQNMFNQRIGTVRVDLFQPGPDTSNEFISETIKIICTDQNHSIEDISIYEIITRNKIKVKLAKIIFKQQSLPNFITFAGRRIKVQEQLPRPMQCRKCLLFGHTSKRCKKEEQRCARCNTTEHPENDCRSALKCANCLEPHHAFDRICPHFIYHQEVQIRMLRYGITRGQAKRDVIEAGRGISARTFKSVITAPPEKNHLETSNVIQTQVNISPDHNLHESPTNSLNHEVQSHANSNASTPNMPTHILKRSLNNEYELELSNSFILQEKELESYQIPNKKNNTHSNNQLELSKSKKLKNNSSLKKPSSSREHSPKNLKNQNFEEIVLVHSEPIETVSQGRERSYSMNNLDKNSKVPLVSPQSYFTTEIESLKDLPSCSSDYSAPITTQKKKVICDSYLHHLPNLDKRPKRTRSSSDSSNSRIKLSKRNDYPDTPSHNSSTGNEWSSDYSLPNSLEENDYEETSDKHKSDKTDLHLIDLDLQRIFNEDDPNSDKVNDHSNNDSFKKHSPSIQEIKDILNSSNETILFDNNIGSISSLNSKNVSSIETDPSFLKSSTSEYVQNCNPKPHILYDLPMPPGMEAPVRKNLQPPLSASTTRRAAA